MRIEGDTLPRTYTELHALTLSLIDSLQHLERQSNEHQATIERQTVELKAKAAYIEKLVFELARLKRWRFGSSSEQINSAQLTLWQMSLDEDIAEAEKKLDQVRPERPRSSTKRQAKRSPLPANLPRIDHRYDLEAKCCSDCGNTLVQFGEEVCEQLDYVPAQFLVHRHIRPKYTCRHCETVVTAPLPAQVIDKGLPAPGLCAHVVVSKYAYHLPLHRQEVIDANQGIHIARSTRAGWVGYLGVVVEPLVAAMHRTFLSQSYLQADETPVPVLAPGTGKTKRGYLWAYRTGPWNPIQAVVFDYAPTRAQQWPSAFLQNFRGILQIDGYSGYNPIIRREDIIEAGCLAHCRRKFKEVYEATRSPTALHALKDIAELYRIETELKSLPAEERVQLRRQRAGPILDDFKCWLENTLQQLPGRSSLAAAVGYTLGRWQALRLYLDHGEVNIDNNPVERTIRGVALGRKNYLFAGSDNGGHRAALMYSLIETCKLNHIDPYAYFKDIFTRLPTLPDHQLEKLLPWNWTPHPADNVPINISVVMTEEGLDNHEHRH